MIRCIFKQPTNDPGPVNWPINHPYWVTGKGEGYFTIVAYADNEGEILKNWPEAYDLNSQESDKYIFNDRFPKPEWMQ